MQVTMAKPTGSLISIDSQGYETLILVGQSTRYGECTRGKSRTLGHFAPDPCYTRGSGDERMLRINKEHRSNNK